ncbi:MAG: hypothetical protein A2039_00680 [Candidatus Melainabacteria bacterium GWA2_34_9]|nr:MAG: hypothetical protein A2039_00680 [Candidatus Melainabacteria bacterium GWA2_34_9]
MHNLVYTPEAKSNLADLKKQGQIKKLKKIKLTLEKLQENSRHPGLHTHKYKSFKSNNGEEIFQSYIENKTPGAFRMFWHYGPDQTEITIVAITPHP